MNTFRNKHYKNVLDLKYTFYGCFRSSELKTAIENFFKEWMNIVNLNHYQIISKTKNKNLNYIQNLLRSYEFLCKFTEVNIILKLGIEILLLTRVLVYFGAILTAIIYSKSVKEIQCKILFCN